MRMRIQEDGWGENENPGRWGGDENENPGDGGDIPQ